MIESGYDECVHITRFLMKIVGIWPDIKSKMSWYSRYQFLVSSFFILFFINIPQTSILPYTWEDLNHTLEILCIADVITGICLLKLLAIRYNKKDFEYLLKEMIKDWKYTNDVQQKVMRQNMKFGNIILTGLSSATVGALIFHTVNVLLLLNSFEAQDDTNIPISSNKPMFLNGKFIFNTEKRPIFEIIFVCQFIAVVIGASAYVSFDGFFIVAILHLCAQLTNLRFHLKELTTQSSEEFLECLRLIVKKHIQLHRFSDLVENNFNKVFLVQILCYSVLLCLQGYQLIIILNTENSKRNIVTIVFIMMYICISFMSLFIYCFMAEKLRTESSNMFFDVYEISWYKWEPRKCKMLLQIMYATRLPFKLTTGKFAELSFELFGKVLKTSLGYLSMLLAVKSRVIPD